MKKYLLILSLIILVYFAYNKIYQTTPAQDIKDQSSDLPPESNQLDTSMLRVVFYQDVSGSITHHGVTLISSCIFNPIFLDESRSYEIYFGVIDNLSAEKLLVINLPKKNFVRPIRPDISGMQPVESRQAKAKYSADLKKYEYDSIEYASNRERKVKNFCLTVDSLVALYNKNLARSTDLITATNIADVVFNFSKVDNSKNYLLLNSDGLDTYGRHAEKLKNEAEVILINANALGKTDIDKIVTEKLESPEQAIEYILTNKTI